MSVRKFTVSAADVDLSLAEFVAERLGIDRAAAGNRIARGAISVGRDRASDPDAPVVAGQRIVARDPEAEIPQLSIVHRDRDALIVDKPPGVPSQATRAGIASAQSWVEAIEPDARLVHRLDRDASGLLLFARSRAASARFQHWLDSGELGRIYRAVVWGHPAAATQLIDRPVGPDPVDRRRQTVGAGRPASTHMTVLATDVASDGSPIAALELRLITGRTHQIRVHLASIGHPVCGDPLYGLASPPGPPIERLALWLHQLTWPGGGHRAAAAPTFAELGRLIAALHR